MNIDPTENIRREMVEEINSKPAEVLELEAKYGQVWNTEQLREEYVVEGFMSPFVVVRRKSDRKKGTLMFQHNPRLYFSFQED